MDDTAEGMAMLLLLATGLPALGVAAAFGSAAFPARDLAATKGLPRRAEIGMLVVSLVFPVLFVPLLWSGISGFGDGRGTLDSYPLGAAFPVLALAFAAYCRPRPGKGTKSRPALLLAVLSYSLYAAPALLCGYMLL